MIFFNKTTVTGTEFEEEGVARCTMCPEVRSNMIRNDTPFINIPKLSLFYIQLNFDFVMSSVRKRMDLVFNRCKMEKYIFYFHNLRDTPTLN